MVRLPRPPRHLHRLHRRRLHARQEENTKRSPAAGIPQGTRSLTSPPLPPFLLAPLLTTHPQWLVSRAELARVDPRYAFPQSAYSTYRPEYYAQYRMQTDMPPPPPMYDPSGRPPTYSAPVGGTKTAPSQWTQAPTHRPADEEYGAAPPGPPPAHTAAAPVAPEHTGSTNPYRS